MLNIKISSLYCGRKPVGNFRVQDSVGPAGIHQVKTDPGNYIITGNKGTRAYTAREPYNDIEESKTSEDAIV